MINGGKDGSMTLCVLIVVRCEFQEHCFMIWQRTMTGGIATAMQVL
jgi:hypothetical protein